MPSAWESPREVPALFRESGNKRRSHAGIETGNKVGVFDLDIIIKSNYKREIIKREIIKREERLQHENHGFIGQKKYFPGRGSC